MNRISDFRTRLEEMLTERGIRASQLSRDSGVNKATISQYLKGVYEPKREQLCKIADALGVNAEWLEGYDTVKYAGDDPESVCRVCVYSLDNLTDPIRAEVCHPQYGSCFYVEADDHLYPAACRGDLVLISPGERPDNGNAALLSFREYYGLYIYRLCSDGVELCCTNGYYPPVKVRGDELGELNVVGKVIMSIHKW